VTAKGNLFGITKFSFKYSFNKIFISKFISQIYMMASLYFWILITFTFQPLNSSDSHIYIPSPLTYKKLNSASVFIYFLWFSQQTASICLNINWLVSLTRMLYVHCEAEIGFSNTIWTKFIRASKCLMFAALWNKLKIISMQAVCPYGIKRKLAKYISKLFATLFIYSDKMCSYHSLL
jgi:hypothetical protein